MYIFSAKESLVTLKFRSEKKDELSKYPALFIPTINHLNIYLSMLQTILYINHCRVQNEYRCYSKVHEAAFYASQKTAISYHTIELLTYD